MVTHSASTSTSIVKVKLGSHVLYCFPCYVDVCRCCVAYKTVSGVNGPLVILEGVKVNEIT